MIFKGRGKGIFGDMVNVLGHLGMLAVRYLENIILLVKMVIGKSLKSLNSLLWIFLKLDSDSLFCIF